MSRDGYTLTARSSARASPHRSASAQLRQSDMAGYGRDQMQGKNILTQNNDKQQGSHLTVVPEISSQSTGGGSGQSSPDADEDEDGDAGGEDDDDEDEEEAEHIAPSGNSTINSNHIKSKEANNMSAGAKPSTSRAGLGGRKNGLLESKGIKRRRDQSLGAVETNERGDSSDSGLDGDRHVSKKMVLEETRPHEISHVISDEDDYAAVDFISDAEGEDPDVEKLEEIQIIDEEGSHAKRKQSFSSVRSGFTDLAQGLILSDMPFYDLEADNDETAFALGLPLTPDNEPQHRKRSDSSARRVRFQDQRSSSGASNSGDSDLRSDLFPDLYVERTSLRYMENGDVAGSAANSGSGSERSYWDLKGGDFLQDKVDGHLVPSDGNDPDNSSSDYKSQAGDTTDDDEFIPATISRPSSLLSRQVSSNSPVQGGNSRASQLRSAPPSNKKGPIMGSWAVDRSQTVAFIDKTGTMVVMQARVPRTNTPSHLWSHASASSNSSMARSSPQNSFSTLAREDSEMTENSQNLVDSMAVSTTGVFRTASGNELFIGSQLLEQRRVLHSVQSGVKSQVRNLEDKDADDNLKANGEDMLKIEDFFDFGDTSDSDDDQEAPEDVSMVSFSKAPATASAGSTTATLPNEADYAKAANLLGHLGNGNVTAFRQHQNNYRQASSLPQHPAMRASIMEDNALQAGTANVANSPITPPRKRGHSKGGPRDSGLQGDANLRRVRHGRVTSTS